MNKSERLKALLVRGYFPAELPPPFNTDDLGRFRNYVATNWPNEQPPKTSPETYNVQRIGWKRRSLSIVNPISQFFLSREIADNWIEVRNHLSQGLASLDHAYLDKDGSRSVPKPDFAKIEFMKLRTGGDYDHILISDISRYYGTIYTHTIPWALKGKSWCKANINTPALKATLGDRLDRLVRKGQDNQTIGIPVGPDTSRIISELIAVAVEKRFFELSPPCTECTHRFVDDWFVGHNTAQAAETAIRDLAEACAEFELELNLEKTRIIDAKDEIVEVWPAELLELMVEDTTVKLQTRQLNRFFSKAFSLAKENASSNVMDYALKLSRSFKIRKETYPLFESFVLRTARAYPITLPVVVQILVNYRLQGAPIDTSRCRKLVLDELHKSVPLRHTAEVAWVLFLAKALNIEISEEFIDPISRIDNSVWALIALDLDHRGLITGGINKDFWNGILKEENLVGPNWLLSYEADLKGWLVPSNPNFVKDHPWFKVMRAKNISFYDENKNVETFKNSQIRSVSEAQKRRTTIEEWLGTLFTMYV